MTDSRPPSPKAETMHELQQAKEEIKVDAAEADADTDLATAHEIAHDFAHAPEDNAALVEKLRTSLEAAQATIATQTIRLSSLADTETELAALRDQFQFVSAAKEAVEQQLKEEVKRREVAEENVELLRGQVEQARRGVGLLHKQEQERKRMSLLPPAVPISVEEVSEEDDAAAAAASKASKRTSILARNPRRASGQEGEFAGTLGTQAASSPAVGLGAPPRAGGLRELRLSSGGSHVGPGGSLVSPTRVVPEEGGDNAESPQRPLFNHASSSTGGVPSSTHSSPSKSKEDKLRAELAATRAKLAIAEEARDASETCLTALREFMAGGGQGSAESPQDLLKGIQLPPLPTDRDPDETSQEEDTLAKKGWGFKIWRQPPTTTAVSPPASTAVEPSFTPADALSVAPSFASGTNSKTSPLQTPGELPTESTVGSVPLLSTPLASFVSGWTKSVVPGTPGDKSPAVTRSIGSFFSRKKDETAAIAVAAPVPVVDQDKDLPDAPTVVQALEESEPAQETAAPAAEGEESIQGELKVAEGSPAGELSNVPLGESTEEGTETKEQDHESKAGER